MVILGLLLLACTAAFVGLVIADNLGGGAVHSVTVLGHQIATMNGLAIFCAGLALAVVFGLGLILTMTGLAMRRRRKRRLGATRTDVAAIARERDELAARLDRIHAEHINAEERGAAAAPDAGGEAGPGAAAGTGAGARTGAGADKGAEADAGAGRDFASTSGATVHQDTPRHRHTRHIFGR